MIKRILLMFLILLTMSCNSFVLKGMLKKGEYGDGEKFISSTHLARSYTITLENSKYFIHALSNETGELKEYKVEHGITEQTNGKLYLKPQGILCDEIALSETRILYLDYRNVELNNKLRYVENLDANVDRQNRAEIFKTKVLDIVKLNGTVVLKDSLFRREYRIR